MNSKSDFETVPYGNTTGIAFRTLLLHSSLFPVTRWVEGYYTITPDLQAQAEIFSTYTHPPSAGIWDAASLLDMLPSSNGSVIFRFCKKPKPVQVTLMTRSLALLLTTPLQPPASPQLSHFSFAHRRMSEVSASVCTLSLPVCYYVNNVGNVHQLHYKSLVYSTIRHGKTMAREPYVAH